MIDDPDIYRTAKLMIDKHGDEGSRRATRRANDVEKSGDKSTIWRQIVTTIQELKRGREEEASN